jgi:hypothetical protein
MELENLPVDNMPEGESTVDQTKIVLRYTGSDVDDGSIGVDDLLSALNGFSSAFYRLAEREAPDSKQRIKVNGISKSSANIHLSIFDLAAAHPKLAAAATGAVVYVGKKIADAVIEKIAGVAKAKKHVQNGGYTTEVSVNGNSNQIVIINGVNARLPVDRDVFELLEQGTIDADLDKMSAPLREDAVESFEIKHEGLTVPDLHLDSSDRPYFARARREATTTAELKMTGTMNTISKTNNSGVFIADNGRRIRYRFTSEERLTELYHQFAHLGPVTITCIAKLDENLDVISIDISDVTPLQDQFQFPDGTS